MEIRPETVAVVAIIRSGRRSPVTYSGALSAGDDPRAILDDEHGLLAGGVLERALTEVQGWRGRGICVLSQFDDDYPASLKQNPDRPPLLFIVGDPTALGARGVAVIGTRQPTPAGRRDARLLARLLADGGYTTISGLAAGIDAVAHEAALERNGMTWGVIGSGVDHSYPRENSALQQRIGQEGAVISQFWPESRPSRSTFPMRNALMAGLAEASVIVEAGAMSGTRSQARAALELGRRVVLMERLLDQPWAEELARSAGVAVASTAADAITLVERMRGPISAM